MGKVQVVVVVESENVAGMMEALAATEVAESMTVQMVNGNVERTMPVAKSTDKSDSWAGAAKRTSRRIMTEGRNLVAYVPALKLGSASKIKEMDLTPQQTKVALFVMKHKSATNAEIAEGTDINRKSVESACYVLRHTKPAILKSIRRDA